MKLDPHPINIRDIIDSELSALMASLSANHKIDIRIPDNLPLVSVDRVRIGQVITNLIKNATEYSPEESIITLEAHASEGEVVVSVADSGEGMFAEQLERIFDYFYRIEENTQRRRSGSGLGLAISKGIVESHGGRIWAESEGLGRGTIVYFTVPYAPDQTESPEVKTDTDTSIAFS
jgi:signal transduction histidine kinase